MKSADLHSQSFALDIFITGVVSLLLRFRKKFEAEDLPTGTVADNLRDDDAKIRCPLCRWSPEKISRWTCWDCGYPEYFYEGCGTEWNTFETRGVCPTCSHQWKWTSCLSCWGWSKHEDWYGAE